MSNPPADPTAPTVTGPETSTETFNPWSVVNLVFHHLADEGLHPVLGSSGDPGGPAADLLKAMGITPTVQGNRHVDEDVKDQLARLRAAYETPHPSPEAQASHETPHDPTASR